MINLASLSQTRFDRANAVIAALVWLFVMVMYTMTTAPTLSFWDCGEFIAVSTVLGVPHPPGSPLYVLLGRLFSLLPIASDPAMRVNLFSGVSSAFAVMFGYLIVVRLLRAWFTAPTLSDRLVVYGGGVAGALFAAFGLTNWNNAVEAEVYGLTIVLMLCVFWLGLVYRRHQDTPTADRIMFLAVFLAMIGVGVHMMAFIALPIIALFFIIRKNSPTWVWFSVGIFIFLELYLIFALSSRPGEVPFYIPVTIAAVFFFLYIFSFDQIPRLHLWAGLGFLLAMVPLFGTLLRRFGVTSEMMGALNVFGIISFVALLLAGLWCARQFVARRHEDNAAQTYLAPAGFIAAAGIMVALLYLFKGYAPFLLATALLALLLVILIRKYLNWEILIAIVAVTTIIIEVKPFFLAMGIAALAIVLLGLARMLPGWRTALLILAVAVIGFSINAFIPIRAQQEPSINENNPQTISKTIDFLDRKQYGQISMVERMFVRRAEWKNQFGNFERMGFWRFFHEQYGFRGPASVFLILIGLFGAWEILRRQPRLGMAMVLLLLLTSVGLVLYMNFADGTRIDKLTGQDYLEVRDRDYFWSSAFVLFGLSIGIGVAFLVAALRDTARTAKPGLRTAVTAASLLLFAAPAIPIAGNYHYADRSGNFIPYDYGMNLLDSADPNAILFTHGDNDTFPLWCLQETYRQRTDVKVINLSLANTNWYIGQIRSTMGLELPWTDEEIEQLRPQRLDDGTYYRLQDFVVDALVDRYLGERPIYFSVTVGSGARKYRGEPIDSRLTMSGMLYRVEDPHGGIKVNVDESVDFFMNKFRARSIADPTVYKDDATERMTRNYGNAFLMVADTLRKAGDLATAEKLTKTAWNLVPYAGDLPEFLASIYASQGRAAELQTLADTVKFGDKNWIRTLLSRAYILQGDTAQAKKVLESVIRTSGTYQRALEELIRLHLASRDLEGMKDALRLWLQLNPNDKQMAAALRELESGVTIDQLLGGSGQ